MVSLDDGLGDGQSQATALRILRSGLRDAEEAFENALRLNPRYTEAALNLSVTYNDRGKYERAFRAALCAGCPVLAYTLFGVGLGWLMVYGLTHSPQFFSFFPMKVTFGIWVVAMLTSGLVGVLSSAVPSYTASRVNIVDGLRHIG